MNGRQISNYERQWLSGELAAWRSNGLIDEAQASRILDCYETVVATGERKQSRARFVLQAISALLVGLGVLLVIGYNWDQLHWGAKLSLVFGSVAGTHALGFYLNNFTSARRSSEIVFFLGCLLYGTGIWLVAQIFHLDSHYPDGVWWWAIGVLPFAIALDTILLHALFVGLLALWAGMEVTGFSHLSPWLLWQWWPNGAYSLPLLAVPGLVWAYRRQSAAAVALYVPLLAWWVVLQAIAWDLEWRSLYLVGSMGAIFLIIAENHRHGSKLAIPYRIYGTLMVGGALIPPSFASYHREVYRYVSPETDEHQLISIVVMVVAAALVAFTFLLRPLDNQSKQNPLARLQELGTRQWLPLGLVVVMALLALLSFTGTEGQLTATVLANVAMIGFAIWLIRVGLREDRGRLFAAGVLYFLLWTVLRYADLFGGSAGMLGAALMFFLCGATLFGLAMFWGKRKEVRHA